MAVQLPNSMLLHIPKTGGRWVSRNVITAVPGSAYIGDPIYQAHETPDYEGPVIAGMRHPVSLITSLFAHRQRKGFNWDKRVALEETCGCEDFAEFYHNIISEPGIVQSYFEHWTHKYQAVCFVRVENIAQDLIRALNKLEQNVDNVTILKAANEKIGNRGYNLQVPYNLAKAIMKNESAWFKQFGYEDVIAC